MDHDPATPTAPLRTYLPLAVRSAFGGLIMGLANLVPGISGGTMLLAAGIYPRFITAIAELTTLRVRLPSLIVLASVGLSAALGIVLFAGPVKNLVVDHRWIMYSLFIGLTLGGLPLVWRMAKPANRAVALGALGGLAVMIAITIARSTGSAGVGESSFALLLVAGVAGASAMILPGVSGGYLLLLLGQYVPILSAIDQCKTALQIGDIRAALEPAVSTLLPVAIGVAVGVLVVSNTVRWFLLRFRHATLGVLLGLLLGATFGLWPFQESVEPIPGETVVKGRVITEEDLDEIDDEDLPTHYFSPRPLQVAGAIGLVLVGFVVTGAVARVGGEGDSEPGRPDSRET